MNISERFTTPKNYPTEAAAMQARNARAKELRTLHPPRNITPSSYARLARLLRNH